MPSPKPISKPTLVAATVDAAIGLTVRKLVRKYHISERLARDLTRCGCGEEEWRAAVIKQLHALAGKVLLEIDDAVENRRIHPNFLPTTFGILADKIGVLESRTALTSYNITAEINNPTWPGGRTKAQIIEILSGKIFPPFLPQDVDTAKPISSTS